MSKFLLVLAFLGPIGSLDLAVQRAVQSMRSPALEKPMRFVTNVGKPQNCLGLLLGIAVFGGPAGVVTARQVLAAAVPTNLAVELTKRGFNRQRPDGEQKRSNASFPSSHAANAFAFAAVFAWRWRRAAWLYWSIAALIAFSRMYLNRHFLSDVVVGAAIGVVFAWAAVRLMGPGAASGKKS